MIRDRGVGERPIVLRRHVPEAVWGGLEAARTVVPTAVFVFGKHVFEAVVHEEVGGVVVVVEIFVAPVVACDKLAGLQAAVFAAVLAVAVAVASTLTGAECGGVGSGGEGRRAVAEGGAEVVTVWASEGAFADEAGDVVGGKDAVVNFMAPFSWLNGGGEDG